MLDLDTLSQADASLVQQGLKVLGYYQGTTKGKPGPRTKAALRAFYKDKEVNNSSSSFASDLVRVAQGEVGNREIGKNGGASVRKYQKATWLPVGAWPWCAAFVCWCVLQVLKRKPQAWKRPRTAGAWDFLNWATKEKLQVIKSPRKVLPGDIVVFTFSHIGIAVGESKNGKVATVEGNTNRAGSREGDGVYRKSRPLNKIRGIIRF